MSRALITPLPVATAQRVLVTGLTALIVAGGAALAVTGDDLVAPSKPGAAPAAPLVFGDPPVVKGARGGRTDVVTLRVFDDPRVRKGAMASAR